MIGKYLYIKSAKKRRRRLDLDEGQMIKIATSTTLGEIAEITRRRRMKKADWNDEKE